MKIDFKWNKPEAQIAKEKTGGENGLLFLANELKRIMDPYVPAENLALAQNVRTYVEDNAGIVHYTSPYAHYQYKGELYVDPKTGKGAFTDGERFWSRSGVAKRPSGRALSYSKFRHPLATSEWDKSAMTAKRGELTEAYQKYLGGKG